MLNSNFRDTIHQLTTKGDFDLAETALKAELEKDESHHCDTLALLARCQLAQKKFEEALHSYRHIQKHKAEQNAAAFGEAALVQDDLFTSLALFKKTLEEDRENAELMALLAVNEYLVGYIKHAAIHLEAAVLHDFEWEDETPIDFVFQQVLPVHEYHDFEQIYLDAVDKVHENAQAKNRWFSLNMPVFDIFSASDVAKQKKRSLYFTALLSPKFDENFVGMGKAKLVQVLQDLAQSSSGTQFGESALHEFEKENYPKISQLILSLLLEHTEQFAQVFGLTAEFVKNSQLQELVPVLPLRMATALMFLYSSSDPKDKINHLIENKMDSQLYAALLAACFITYYQQVEIYKRPEKEHFETGYT